MSVVVITGAQWGDEGKGKVVDLYAERADLVVRYSGGANAGHTLVVKGETLITHLIPSGVLHPGTRCVLGDGMVIDPETLLDEIAECKARGLLADDADLWVGKRAHVIFPFHKEIDHLRESKKNAIGTTKRGIGPAYEAKAARRGIRMGDLLSESRLRDLLELNLEVLNPYVKSMGGTPYQVAPLLQRGLELGNKVGKYLAETGRLVHQAISDGKNVLFEGAQGALLDIDHGTYPFVTSSTTLAGGVCSGVGVGPTVIEKVVGISKAYATRVGSGPFPTELHGEAGDRLREAGAEYGATTGRPRRCGWLDLPALKLAVRTNGMTGLALTKLDVLKGMGRLKVCVGYRVGGEVRDELPLEPLELAEAEPVYEELDGFDEETREIRSLDALPGAARAYVHRIQSHIGVPVYLVSVGPGRAETIVLENPFE